MRTEVPGWLVAVVVIIILAIAAFAYWYSGRTRPTEETEKLPSAHQPAPLPTAPVGP